MKTVLILFTLISSYTCVASNMPRTEYKRARLNGKVKSVRCYYTDSFDVALASDSGRRYCNVDSYDNAGRVIYSYKLSGRKKVTEEKYVYDIDGKLKKECYFKLGQPVVCCTYTYDTSGNLTQEKQFMSGEFIRQITYSYVSGLLTREVYSDPRRSGSMDTTEYSYDSKGRLIQKKSGGRFGNYVIQMYTYYDNDNIQTEVDGGGSRTTTYTYDEYNNEVLAVELQERNGEKAYRRFASEYVYDSRGNWIRVINYDPEDKNGSGSIRRYVETREIEYY